MTNASGQAKEALSLASYSYLIFSLPAPPLTLLLISLRFAWHTIAVRLSCFLYSLSLHLTLALSLHSLSCKKEILELVYSQNGAKQKHFTLIASCSFVMCTMYAVCVYVYEEICVQYDFARVRSIRIREAWFLCCGNGGINAGLGGSGAVVCFRFTLLHGVINILPLLNTLYINLLSIEHIFFIVKLLWWALYYCVCMTIHFTLTLSTVQFAQFVATDWCFCIQCGEGKGQIETQTLDKGISSRSRFSLLTESSNCINFVLMSVCLYVFHPCWCNSTTDLY